MSVDGGVVAALDGGTLAGAAVDLPAVIGEVGDSPPHAPRSRHPRPTARTTGRKTRRSEHRTTRRNGNGTANEKRLHGTNTGTDNGTPNTRRHGRRKDGREEAGHRSHFPIKMRTVTELGRDAGAFDKNPLKTMSEQASFRSQYPANPAHF